jgi:hypothetical protein
MSTESEYTAKVRGFLSGQLDADEPILAQGTGEERRRLSRNVTSGSGDFFLVTPRRLLWSPTGSPDHRVSLDFDAVTSWSEGTQYHRYALVLRHAVVERIGWAPAHRVLWFEWGDTEKMKQQTQTILHFSRRDTKVASAIRDQIARRNVPTETPLEFDEQSREERFGTSKMRLWPRDGEFFRS